MKKTNILTLMLMLTVSVAFGQNIYPPLNYDSLTFGKQPRPGILSGTTIKTRNLWLPNIQNGSATDSVLTIVNGLVKKVPKSSFTSPLTFINGLTKTGDNVALGGDYTSDITIGNPGNKGSLFLSTGSGNILFPKTGGGYNIVNSNSQFASLSSGLNSISVSDKLLFTDVISNKGALLDRDYSKTWTVADSNYLAPKAYVDRAISGGSGTYELLANKSTTLTSPNNTTYPTTLAVSNALVAKISGTGTVNYIPKFTAAGTIGNSTIIDDGTNIGIGTNSPTQKLEVNGMGRFYGDFGSSGGTGLRLNNTNALGYSEIVIDNDAPIEGGGFVFGYGGTTSGVPNMAYFTQRRNAPILFQTNNTTRFSIDGIGNTIVASLSGTGDRPVFAGSDGVLKIGTIQTPVFQTSGTSATLLSSGRYIPQNASLTIYTLPTTAAVGDVIFINGKGSGGWRISQNTGQVIHGATDTTTGSAGYVGSTARYNSIAIVCVTANTEWIIQSSQGSLTIN